MSQFYVAAAAAAAASGGGDLAMALPRGMRIHLTKIA